MKILTPFQIALTVLFVSLLLRPTAGAQTDSFTYQGRLERNGTPYTGTASMRLGIMDAASAGAELAFTFGAYPVADGQFTVTFTSVPASVFNGTPRWINIGVDDPDVAGLLYVNLTPRQQVTATPYAMRANVAATVSGTVASTQITGAIPTTQISGNLPTSQISGNLPTSQLSGTINPSVFATGTATGTLTFSPPAGAPFAVGSATKVINLNSDLLDGLDSTAFLLRSGGAMLNTTKVTSLNSDLLDGLDSTSFLTTSGGAMLNTNKVTNLNSDLLDGLDSTAFLTTSGGTITGVLNTGNLNVLNPGVLDFGSTTRQNINLWGGGDFGIGVQTATMYQRTNTNFAWYQGGAHNNAPFSPGGGATLMTLTDSLLTIRPGVNNNDFGQGPIRIAFGDKNPSNMPYVTIGESDTDDQMDIRANKINLSTLDGGSTNLSFGENTGQHLILFENASDTYGMGVQSNYEYFRTGENFAWYKDGVHSDVGGDAGGGSTLMTLAGSGELEVRGAGNGLALHNRTDQTKRWVMYSRNSGPTDELAFYSDTTGDVASLSKDGNLYLSGGTNRGVTLRASNLINNSIANLGIGLAFKSDLIYFRNQADATTAVINSVGDLNLTGALSTTVLTIRGGADVAEPFEMSQPEELEPGSVVIIDDEHPGKLKQSTQSNDTRVAGIISGAGGVKPGLRLHQDGVLEGDHHVALSGRVYVKADTSGGRIKPGDLLTTSDTPGHATKVTDHDRSQGAILGKAMTALDEGSGLVLVLVTLQ